MCSGSKRRHTQTSFAMEGEYGEHAALHHKFSVLLEFSALDDLMGFKDAIEQKGHDVGEVGLWYGRRIGSKKMGYEERTPLMVAAMFGSKGVLSYILGICCIDVNQMCGSDRATALHCAVAGGSAASPEVVKLLLDASADVNAVDANGNRPSDLIVFVPHSILNSRKRFLQAILNSIDDIDEACHSPEESVGLGQMEQHQQQDMTTPHVSKDRTEKKDYPVDLSLPDIKNGIYGTDEFRMYSFKVKPCSRAYSHDWTECPFVHPGENARRRDPRKYHYSCVPCPEFRKGLCSKGDACEYAHGIFESWLHPAQYRTKLCKDETGCTRRVCFFAHKPEELRPLYASTGSAMPSPMSFSPSASSLEMGLINPFTLGSPSVLIPLSSTPPLTPSGASSPLGGTMWQMQSNGAVPTLQLPRSRLKTALCARDIDLGIELLGLENHRRRQQMMMDEISGLSSPSSWNNAMPNNPSLPVSLGDLSGEFNRLKGVKPTKLEDIFGSLDPSILPKLQGLSLDSVGPQLHSPTGIQVLQNGNQHLRIYSSRVSTSNGMLSPSFGVDPSGAAATAAGLNPRIAGFTKRSQSFIERSMVYHHPDLPSPMKPSCTFSDWSSPDGKLDWTIHGEELNKLRKSASFGFRSSGSPLTMATIGPGQFSVEEKQQQLQCHLDSETDVFPAWLEQLYVEQEPMVA